MSHEILDGDPVCIEMFMPTNAIVTFTLDSSTYPSVALGGTTATLANKTIRLSNIFMYLGAAAGEVLEYIKIDDWIVTSAPFQVGYLGVGIYYDFNIEKIFGRKYLAIRNTIKVKMSAAAAGTAKYYFQGIATDARTE